MFAPLQVDPDWYEKYWLTDSPLPKQPRLARRLARLTVAVALLGGGVMLSHFHPSHSTSTYAASQQE
jgi:hypothetical protein